MDELDSRLVQVVRHAKSNTAYYANKYADIDLDTFCGRPDLGKLPIISPADLVENHLAFRASGVTPYRISSSSGTSRHPKTLFRTTRDTEVSSNVMCEL